jgi:hypothetical protein
MPRIPVEPEGPTCGVEGGEFRIRIPRLKHFDQWGTPALRFAFDSIEKAHSFNLDYVLSAENIPHRENGRLDFILASVV